MGGFVLWECRAGAQINFPESGRGIGHVTPKIFGRTVGYPSDSLSLLLQRYSSGWTTERYVACWDLWSSRISNAHEIPELHCCQPR